jgi:exopolysaccharide biosynthesis polyprenyl glycosylphosphotransferase
LFLFIATFALIEAWWRRTWNIRASFREGLNRVLLLDASPHATEVVHELTVNPQIGYGINVWHKEKLEYAQLAQLRALVREHDINLIVVPQDAKHHPDIGKIFYGLLSSGVEITDLPSFYESVFRKVPLSEIREGWFIEHRIGQKKFYDDLKRGGEFIFSLFLMIILSPLLLAIALLVKITSRGPAILAQTRIGKNGESFTLYKFRSMYALAQDGSAETNGAVWAGTQDPRVTPLGRVLRYSHLDELPQLANIITGKLSFVGPRPERPEIVKKLLEKIPYYEVRLLVKPGVTGWAQINYGKDQTDEDVKEKLQHDIYYLKNRSVILDFAIVLKTFKSLFINHP